MDEVVAVLGSFPALAGASLTVKRSEILVVRGSNGAGKTTLLKVCAGLVPIERGCGRVLGIDLVSDRDLVKKNVGYLAHHNGLYADLTVFENVMFWARISGANVREVELAIDRLGLSGRLAHVRAGALSSGQRRRTALACLMVRRSQLWLLDEPHSGLDEQGRNELDEVLRIAADSGATIVVASHELDRVASLATRQIEIVGGRIREWSER